MNTKQRQSPMNTRQRPGAALTVTAATLATVIGFGILWTVVTLFHSRDALLENTAAARRACAHHAYESEREACLRQTQNVGWSSLQLGEPGTEEDK